MFARFPDDRRDRALRYGLPRPEFAQVEFNVVCLNPDPLVRLIMEVRLDAVGFGSVALAVGLEYPGHLFLYGYHMPISVQL